MALRLVSKAVSDSLLLGVCVPSLHATASKIRVPMLDLDTYLLAYFKKVSFFYAYDPEKICKTGDLVLIKKLSKSVTKLITHEVVEIAYPLGDVTDPVTGEKCIGSKNRKELEKEAQLYGLTDSAFLFNKAPNRGWQEGKRDFTDKEIYVKYFDFDADDENSEQPYSIF